MSRSIAELDGVESQCCLWQAESLLWSLATPSTSCNIALKATASTTPGKFQSQKESLSHCEKPGSGQHRLCLLFVPLPRLADIFFLLQNFEVKADDLEPIMELGRGAYGVVEKMRHVPSGQIMAVKVELMFCFPSAAHAFVHLNCEPAPSTKDCSRNVSLALPAFSQRLTTLV